jgi:ATP-dependent DNA helicase RecG
MALAVMRNGREVSSSTLRGWDFDRATGTMPLTGLVARDVAIRDDGRRYATYRLNDDLAIQGQRRLPLGVGQPTTSARIAPPLEATARISPGLADVLAVIERDGVVTGKGVMVSLGIGYGTAIRRLNRLIELGLVEATAPPQSRKRAYQRAGSGD